MESPRLNPLSLHQLFALDIAPRGMVLDPIIPEKGLAMLYAARGTGKTHVALGIACAVAGGHRFLNWHAPRPRRVLFIDGEMPAAALRDRLAAIVGSQPPPLLTVLAGDLTEGGIGNLAAPALQAELEPHLDGVELVVLDNLASLTAAWRDDAVCWLPIQEWLLRLRRRGISVLIVHHAGKSGDQRGTSRREDMLDTTIGLVRPVDYKAQEGARFEVRIEKCRGVLGDEAEGFEARLDPHEGRTHWTVTSLINAQGRRVAELANAGLSIREIAAEAGMSKSTVHRLHRKMLEAALARRRAQAGQNGTRAGTA